MKKKLRKNVQHLFKKHYSLYHFSSFIKKKNIYTASDLAENKDKINIVNSTKIFIYYAAEVDESSIETAKP